MIKKPKSIFDPKISKNPTQSESNKPQNFDAQTPVWQFKSIDKDGRWGWEKITKETLWNSVIEKIKNYETMTWYSLNSNGSHSIAKIDIINEAQKRLRELGQDDIDKLYSLRLTGKQRMWGIKDGRILKILWFDPKHEICPSLKK